MEFNKIFNKDCFDAFKLITKQSIDLVLVDLPYGQTACEWDEKLDLKLMWENLKRICKPNTQYIFFYNY
jgi:DNA modification methylase